MLAEYSGKIKLLHELYDITPAANEAVVATRFKMITYRKYIPERINHMNL